eukprot:COSAG02_NODE_1581_length_11839_cov_9.055451_3_plen_623_part_00
MLMLPPDLNLTTPAARALPSFSALAVPSGFLGHEGLMSCSYEEMTVAELKELATDRQIKRVGVGWPECCPPDGNKAAIVHALAEWDGLPAVTPTEGQNGSQPEKPPVSVVREPQEGEPQLSAGQPEPESEPEPVPDDLSAYRPRTTCGRTSTAELTAQDNDTADLLHRGLKLPPHVPLICTSFRSSNLKDVDGRVRFCDFVMTTLHSSRKEAEQLVANLNACRTDWGLAPIVTMLDYSRAKIDEWALAHGFSNCPDLDKGEPTAEAEAAAAKILEEVGVADPWSTCDYIRERAAWTYDSVFIDAEAYGMYQHWHTVYRWAQKHCEVMVMFISRAWYHSKWCTKEWFQDYKALGAEMPKVFVVLLDQLPVTGYRIDDDSTSAPLEGTWVPEETIRSPREFWLAEIKKMQTSVSRSGLTSGPADVTFGGRLDPANVIDCSAYQLWEQGRAGKTELKQAALEMERLLGRILSATGREEDIDMNSEEWPVRKAVADAEREFFLSDDWLPRNPKTSIESASKTFRLDDLGRPVRNMHRDRSNRRLNLNDASAVGATEIAEKVPLIGPKLAADIIAYRTRQLTSKAKRDGSCTRPISTFQQLLKKNGGPILGDVGGRTFESLMCFTTL